MKKLLQSKRFRKNLAKWLFMYIGIIAFLTTVITYSRYITEIGSSDMARAAKFNIKINYKLGDCDVNKADACNNGIHRPTENLLYDFVVDKSEIEVKTLLSLTIYYEDDFDLIKLSKLDENGEVLVEDVITPNKDQSDTFDTIPGSKYYYQSWNDNVDINDKNQKSYYRATLKYHKQNGYKDVNFNNLHKAMIIGFSAEQVK